MFIADLAENIKHHIKKISELEPDLEAAAGFLKLLDPAADSFLFQTIDNRPLEGQKADCHTLYGSLDEHAPALSEWNRRGHGVYVTVNETAGSRRRKQDITRVRAVFRELDQPDTWIPDLWASLIVETSPGKQHQWLFVDGLSMANFEAVQRFLVAETGSDPSAKDLARVLRVPGFYNMKTELSEPHLVRVTSGDGVRYTSDEITRVFPPEMYSSTETSIAGNLDFTPVARALVESWIAAIPGEKVADYDGWFQFGVALARLGDDWLTEDSKDLRLALWERLSAKAPGYDGSDCADKWEDCLDAAGEARDGQATYRTLLGAACDAGWCDEDCALAEEQELEAWEIVNGTTLEDRLGGIDLSDTVTAGSGGAEERAPEAKGARAKPLRLDAFDFVRVDPLKILIDDILPAGSLYTFTAATGHGKTEWCINAALALAYDRSDLIGKRVEPCRVLYMTAENPDMLKRRLGLSLRKFGIRREDFPTGRLCAIGGFLTPAEMLRECGEMMKEAEDAGESFGFAIIDTLQAYFSGDNSNDNTQVVHFMRSLRPITELTSKPSVIIPAHPTKNAGEDQLVPYGGGGIINEIDGNLIGARNGDIFSLHWQKKLRGPDFKPVLYQSALESDPALVDHRGRELTLPVLRVAEGEAIADKRVAEANATDIRLLSAIWTMPDAKQAKWATDADLAPGSMHRTLTRLKRDKLIDGGKGQYWVTSKGRKIAALGLESPLQCPAAQPFENVLDWSETMQ